MHTQAIVITAPEQVELREVALTAAGPEDVIIQTAYTSISAGTERMLFAGRMPHPMLKLPVVPGYETVGRVVEVGPNAPLDLKGQWVYVGGARCYADVNPAWGGQSATLIVDYRRVVLLNDVPPEQGVLLALGATALHGVDLLTAEGAEQALNAASAAPAVKHSLAGKRVLVLGQGPVGQLAARIAQAQGAWVAVSELSASRLARSQADVRLDGDAPLADTLGGPVDAIVEATGSMAALASAIPALGNNGTVLLLGYYEKLELPYMPLFLKQARLLTAKEWGPNDLQRVRDMIADGTLEIERLITHRMPADQPAAAYRVALEDAECLKLLLEWP
ncbi:MAG: alcohol dehydrogenase catalytic domain-containing protein [Roseiflexaceae bacterium]|nr:alcohol dehydrogenase catalytic domain-containing protein [Roseiflexaceae bacterium]